MAFLKAFQKGRRYKEKKEIATDRAQPRGLFAKKRDLGMPHQRRNNLKRHATTKSFCRAALLLVTALLLAGLALFPALAQQEQPLRGVWIATVYSIDFPHTSTVAGQKQELVDILDTAQGAGLNAVFFRCARRATPTTTPRSSPGRSR